MSQPVPISGRALRLEAERLKARCPACGALLERAELGWTCPRVLSHLKITSDGQLLTSVSRDGDSPTA